MKLKIISHSNHIKIQEVYSEFELFSVFGEVCEMLDSKKMADFNVEIGGYVFKSDFKYDFTSIMPEIIDFYYFLTLKTNKSSFSLNFYELRVKLECKMMDNYLKITVFDDFNRNMLTCYDMLLKDLVQDLKNLIIDFQELLKNNFPIALLFFQQENYMIFKESKFIF